MEKTVNDWLKEQDRFGDKFTNFDLWYDWFCGTSKLEKRGQKLMKIARKLVKKNSKVGDNYRMWFKNNCPCFAPLYDDVRFEFLVNGEDCDADTRNKMYVVIAVNTPSAKKEGKKYEVFDLEKCVAKKPCYSYFATESQVVNAVAEIIEDKINRHFPHLA